MGLRPAISVPLPWLAILFGRLFGRRVNAKGPSRHLFKMPRSLRVTREGKWYIALLFFIGIAAINTGNNLLYLIVATLLSFIVISGIMSESTLRGLKVKRVLPDRFFKGSPANLRYRITNSKRRLPSFSFVLREVCEDGSFVPAPLYMLKLRAGGEETRQVKCTFLRRGRFEFNVIKVETRFPFGLFAKGKEEETACNIVVYPDIRARPGAAQEPIYRGGGTDASIAKGGGTQIYNLRDYTPQDDSRFIYWKSAAKTSKLLVKEFERESERKVLVVLENYSSAPEEAFEDVVDEAASVVYRLVKNGYSVGLKTLGGEMAPRPGAAQLYSILDTLAVIKPSGKPGVPGVKVIYL